MRMPLDALNLAWETPFDQLLPDGGVLLVLENGKGAADLRLNQAEGGVGVQERQKVVNQDRTDPEPLLCNALMVTGCHLKLPVLSKSFLSQVSFCPKPSWFLLILLPLSESNYLTPVLKILGRVGKSLTEVLLPEFCKVLTDQLLSPVSS